MHLLVVAVSVAVFVLLPLLLFNPRDVIRRLDKLRYQYEVTLGLYMLTPTEKFILNSIFLLVFSMLGVGAFLYLPENLSVVTDRALYYLAGDKFAPAESITPALVEMATSQLAT